MKKGWLTMVDHQLKAYTAFLGAVWAESEVQMAKYAAVLAVHDDHEDPQLPFCRHESVQGDEEVDRIVAWASQKHWEITCECNDTERLVWLTHVLFQSRVEFPGGDQAQLLEMVTERIHHLMFLNFDYES